jgi:hypothetical protein
MVQFLLTVRFQNVTLGITSHIETCNEDNSTDTEALQTPVPQGADNNYNSQGYG